MYNFNCPASQYVGHPSSVVSFSFFLSARLIICCFFFIKKISCSLFQAKLLRLYFDFKGKDPLNAILPLTFSNDLSSEAAEPILLKVHMMPP